MSLEYSCEQKTFKKKKIILKYNQKEQEINQKI